MNHQDNIKQLADSLDAANRLLALQLSKSIELKDSEIQYSCGAILDKIPMLGSPTERRDTLLDMSEKSPKVFNNFLDKYK